MIDLHIEITEQLQEELEKALEKSGDTLHTFMQKAIAARIAFTLNTKDEELFKAPKKIRRAIAALMSHNKKAEQAQKIFINRSVVGIVTRCNTKNVKAIFEDPEIATMIQQHHKHHELSVKDNSNKSPNLGAFLKEKISIDS